MPLKCGFFNSVNGDRKYDAKDFSGIFDGILRDGIFEDLEGGFKVEVGSGMSILVRTGRAWFNGTWTHNTTTANLTVSASDPSNTRIDYIVLEIDTSDSVRRNYLKVIKGTPNATNPQPPSLVNTDTKKQYALASIRIPARATKLENFNLKNLVGSRVSVDNPSHQAKTPYAELVQYNASYKDVQSLISITKNAYWNLNVFSGQPIGSVMSDEMSTNLNNNNLKNIRLGDYWSVDGNRWRIVDIRIPHTIKPILIVMPDEPVIKNLKLTETYTQNAEQYSIYNDPIYKAATNPIRAKVQQVFKNVNVLNSFSLPNFEIVTGLTSPDLKNQITNHGFRTNEPASSDLAFGGGPFEYYFTVKSYTDKPGNSETSQFRVFDIAPRYKNLTSNGDYMLSNSRVIKDREFKLTTLKNNSGKTVGNGNWTTKDAKVYLYIIPGNNRHTTHAKPTLQLQSTYVNIRPYFTIQGK